MVGDGQAGLPSDSAAGALAGGRNVTICITFIACTKR